MEKSVNVVIRILLIVICVIIGVSAVYLYCVKKVNRFYSVAENDPFTSSMKIREIFPMNNGSVTVCGSFLPDDNVYLNESLFFKTYDTEGKLSALSSLIVDEGYEASVVTCDGSSFFVECRNTRGDVKVYTLAEDFSVTSSSSATFDSSSVTGIYAGLCGSDPFIAKVTEGHSVTVRSLGSVILEAEFSEDIEINNVFYVADTFIVKGTIPVSEVEYPYLVGFGRDQTKKFEVTVFESDRDFMIEGFRLLADGNVYVTGKQFNREEYMKAAEAAETEVSKASADLVGDRVVNSAREFGSVLVSEDYLNDPWSTLFICPIDLETGELGTPRKLLNDGPGQGITEIYYSDSYRMRDLLAADFPGKPQNKTVTAALVTKMAQTNDSENYLVNVFLLYNDMSTSRSANIYVTSDRYFYPGITSEGLLFCYTGIAGTDGADMFSMKYYSGTEEAEEDLKLIPVYKNVADTIIAKLEPSLIFYTSVFVLLYLTARYRGTDNAKRARETALLRLS